MKIEEINARLSAIALELDTASGDALTALEKEVSELTAQRSALENEAKSRQELRTKIANGARDTKPAPAAPVDEETVEQKEERAFVDFIMGRVTTMQRTNEQNFSLGNNGALVPTTIARRIIDAVKERCPILAGAEVYRVRGTLKIPVYGSKAVSGTDHNITVAYGADFSELTADAGAFTSIDLGGYLIGALTLVGRQLQNNAEIDVASFVINKMADMIAAFVEGELLAGTGAANNHVTGILSTTNTLNAESTSAITADALIELQAKIPTANQADACWTMNPATFTAIKKLKDANNQYLLQGGAGIVGAFPYTLLGKPVYLSDNMPTIASAAKAVLYGSYKALGVNIREDVSIEVLREKYATQHAIGIVGWMELDAKVIDPQKAAVLVMSVTA